MEGYEFIDLENLMESGTTQEGHEVIDLENLMESGTGQESFSSSVPDFPRNQSQVVLPSNEDFNLPETLASSEHFDFTEYFLKQEGFSTRDELQAWCVDIGISHNFQILCKSSQMKDTLGTGQGSRVQLCCERSGLPNSHRGKNYVPKTTTKKRRKCGTIKCNRPFRLYGSCEVYGIWKLRVGCGSHKHPLPTTLVGHGYAGRLVDKEQLEVEKMTKSGCRPRDILTSLKIDNPKTVQP